jgi:hypothetical protein
MFKRRIGTSSGARGTTTPAVSATAECVHEAEQVVRDAWAVHLVQQQARMDAAVTAATRRYDGAQRRLAAARHSGDPGEIAAAQAALQKALEVLRTYKVAYDHTHRAFLAELELLDRASAAYARTQQQEQEGLFTGAWAGVGRANVPAVPRLSASASSSSSIPTGPAPLISRVSWRARRRLYRILAPRAVTGRD